MLLDDLSLIKGVTFEFSLTPILSSFSLSEF